MGQLIKIYSCLIIIIFLSSCKKEELPPNSIGDPVFNLSFLLNGELKEFEAGNEDYFMFTSFEQDDNGLYHFIGNMAKDNNCQNDCQEYLKISISDVEARETVQINEVFSPSVIPYLVEQLPFDQYRIQFENLSESTTPQFSNEWEYQDTLRSNLFNPEIIVDDHSFPFKAILKVSSNDGCESTQEQEVKKNLEDSCTVNFTVEPLMFDLLFNEVVFKINKYPSSFINNMQWKINGNASPFHSFMRDEELFVILPKVDGAEYCVNSDVSPDCTSTSCRVLIDQEGEFPVFECKSQFEYAVKKVEKEIFARVVVEYGSPEGVIYTSVKADENPNDLFEITQIEGYDRNAQGQSTQKAILKFNAQLNSNNGNTIEISNANATFGFAYPE